MLNLGIARRTIAVITVAIMIVLVYRFWDIRTKLIHALDVVADIHPQSEYFERQCGNTNLWLTTEQMDKACLDENLKMEKIKQNNFSYTVWTDKAFALSDKYDIAYKLMLYTVPVVLFIWFGFIFAIYGFGGLKNELRLLSTFVHKKRSQ